MLALMYISSGVVQTFAFLFFSWTLTCILMGDHIVRLPLPTRTLYILIITTSAIAVIQDFMFERQPPQLTYTTHAYWFRLIQACIGVCSVCKNYDVLLQAPAVVLVWATVGFSILCMIGYFVMVP